MPDQSVLLTQKSSTPSWIRGQASQRRLDSFRPNKQSRTTRVVRSSLIWLGISARMAVAPSRPGGHHPRARLSERGACPGYGERSEVW